MEKTTANLKSKKDELCGEKKNLQAQLGLLNKILRIVRHCKCTPAEEIMQAALVKELELRRMPLIDAINDLNTKIYIVSAQLRGEVQG